MKMLTTVVFVLALVACTDFIDHNNEIQSCSSDWYSQLENKISTGDGHGPDLGSLEWRSVIEFKLGIRNDSTVPTLESEQWCDYIHNEYINPLYNHKVGGSEKS
jgi:hypothetical protein